MLLSLMARLYAEPSFFSFRSPQSAHTLHHRHIRRRWAPQPSIRRASKPASSRPTVCWVWLSSPYLSIMHRRYSRVLSQKVKRHLLSSVSSLLPPAPSSSLVVQTIAFL